MENIYLEKHQIKNVNKNISKQAEINDIQNKASHLII